MLNVVAEVEEQHGRVSVHALQAVELQTVELVAAVYQFHYLGQGVELAAVGYAERAVGIVVVGIEFIESVGYGLIVGLSEQACTYLA